MRTARLPARRRVQRQGPPSGVVRNQSRTIACSTLSGHLFLANLARCGGARFDQPIERGPPEYCQGYLVTGHGRATTSVVQSKKGWCRYPALGPSLIRASCAPRQSTGGTKIYGYAPAARHSPCQEVLLGPSRRGPGQAPTLIHTLTLSRRVHTPLRATSRPSGVSSEASTVPTPPCARRRLESRTPRRASGSGLYVGEGGNAKKAVPVLSARHPRIRNPESVLTVGRLTAIGAGAVPASPVPHLRIPLLDPGSGSGNPSPLVSASCANGLPAHATFSPPPLHPCIVPLLGIAAAATVPPCRSVQLRVSEQLPSGCYHDVPGEQPEGLFPR